MKTGLRLERAHEVDVFRKSLANVRRGAGSIICIAGESGYGKSFLLDDYTEECARKESGVVGVIVEGQPPIGSFNVGNLQPLLPFQRALEKLLSNNVITPEKKFMMSIGMTVLATLPLAGEVFYAVKEISKDYRQFKKEKVIDKRIKGSNVIQEFIDSLMAFAEKQPVVILMDDMHWCDAQSVELLNIMAEKIENMPIVIALTYKKSVVEDSVSPLLTFLKHHTHKTENIFNIELQGFDTQKMSDYCNYYLPNYSRNKVFDDWLFVRSNGVPGVLADYVKYFQQYSPFREDGTLVENFGENEFLPGTAYAAFAQVLVKLSEEERNVLALCSAEGREFTALVAAQLLNTDILTAIKKLRHLQGKTGVIHSIGAHSRYGVKTTIYEFTQAFYQTFFENSLEYEEHVSLHGQIAAFLKMKYDEADNEALRNQIAPYLAAHSAESGDEDTAKIMLIHTAQNAEKMGNAEIVQSVYDKYLSLTKGKDIDEQDNPESLAFKEMIRTASGESTGMTDDNMLSGSESVPGGTSYMDFITVRKVAVGYYHQNKYAESADYILRYLNKHETDLRVTEKVQLLSIVIKAFIELDDLSSAENYCQKAIALIHIHNDPIAECFVMNVAAMLRVKQNRQAEASDFLQKAVKRAINMPNELQLLTITSIAMIGNQPEKLKKKYLDAARDLSSRLRFEDFSEDLNELMRN